MRFKVEQRVFYVGGWSWDLTVAPEPQMFEEVTIVRAGDGGWDWWVRSLETGDEHMADECQLLEPA